MSALGLGIEDEVASDLRAPVSAIRGCLEAALDGSTGLSPSERDGLLGAALREAETLAVTLEGLEARLEALARARSAARAAT